MPHAKTRAAQPGRKRSETARRSILDAALLLAWRGGYRSVTMDGIAKEAGVGKQTVYRWWGSRADVVLEALGDTSTVEVPIPDTGSLRGDLEAYLSAVVAITSRHRANAELLRGLFAEALLDAEFREKLRALFIAPRQAALRIVFERARPAGVRGAVDLDLILDLLFGAFFYRLGLLDQAPDGARLSQLAQTLSALYALQAPARKLRSLPTPAAKKPAAPRGPGG